MDSHDENHPALELLRAWKSNGTSLELIFTAPSGPNITTPVSLTGISPSELKFVWAQVSPSSGSPLLRAEGTISVLLADASLLPNEDSSPADKSPSAAVHIWRGAILCLIRPSSN